MSMNLPKFLLLVAVLAVLAFLFNKDNEAGSEEETSTEQKPGQSGVLRNTLNAASDAAYSLSR